MRVALARGELSDFLADQAPDVPVYQVRPVPGQIMASAFDWVAVLGTTADVIAVAGLFWAAYEKLIKQRKKPAAQEEPGLLLQIKTSHRTFSQIVIDDGVTKAMFVEEFLESVTTLRESSVGETDASVLERYEKSEIHRRVKSGESA